jgi:nucleoside-diphosphate-sugar epimerase
VWGAVGLDSYTRTKAMAEALVLEANGKGGMLTAAIRPHGIFGPGVRGLCGGGMDAHAPGARFSPAPVPQSTPSSPGVAGG